MFTGNLHGSALQPKPPGGKAHTGTMQRSSTQRTKTKHYQYLIFSIKATTQKNKLNRIVLPKTPLQPEASGWRGAETDERSELAWRGGGQQTKHNVTHVTFRSVGMHLLYSNAPKIQSTCSTGLETKLEAVYTVDHRQRLCWRHDRH